MTDTSPADATSFTPDHDEPLIHDLLDRVARHCERHAGQLEPRELERLADILLRIAGPNDEYPHRASLDHQSLEIHSIDDPHDPAAAEARARPAPSEDTGPTLQALVARLLVAANLVSRRQREVARLHLWGYSLTEIADHLQISYSVAYSRWRSARNHLRRAMAKIPPGEWLTAAPGLSAEQVREVMRADRHRYRYHPPRHCRAGHERCRRTGICQSL